MIVYNSRSVDQTQYLARKLSETINVGSVVMLIGNLGTGKTTFVQGLAMAIGCLLYTSPSPRDDR